MKKIKNVMLLAVGSIAVMAIALTSCKKDSTTTASAPTVTNVTGTLNAGGAITITGTGFTSTGTTATINGTAVTVVFVSATSVTTTVPAGLAAGTYNLIVTVGGTAATTYHLVLGSSGPTSDSIATANLIAHWSFDVNSAEARSGATALTGGAYNVGTVSYTNAGVIGNCATFTNGALVFPKIAQLSVDTALESYTISMWVNFGNGNGAYWKSLFQINSNVYNGLFGIVGIQVLNQYSLDTLALQTPQTQLDNNGVHVGGIGCGGCFNGGAINLTANPAVYAASPTGWTLLTETYNGNGANEKMKLYANGVVIDSATLTDVDKSVSSTQTTFRINPTGGTGTGAPASWNNYVTIGTFNFSDFPIYNVTNGYNLTVPSTAASVASYMSNGITGKLDDIRVFNTPLTQAQITSLYTLGTQGK